jgi:hypothetical protein
MLRRPLIAAIIACALLFQTLATSAQQPALPPSPAKDPNDPIERIKDEGMNRSQVMQTLSYLTDVIGPRLTASPNMKRANEWTRERLASWGLQNSHLESWGPFGRGWTLKTFSAQVTEPQAIPLIAYPKAWSPGLKGTLNAEVVYLNVKTEAELEAYKGKLKGAIVIMTPPPEVKANFEPLGNRRDEKDLLRLADALDPKSIPPRRPQITEQQRTEGRTKGPRSSSSRAVAETAGRSSFNPPQFRSPLTKTRSARPHRVRRNASRPGTWTRPKSFRRSSSPQSITIASCV